ncbi:MAG TPA: CHASE3 domain-containing protein [Burkholderiaceae bacterium]|nr:CHASE3 domain-containing protein [Burkholderiaceae bacterium]
MLTRSLDLIPRSRAWMAPLAVAVAIAFLTVNEVTYQRARDGIASGDEMQAQRVEVRRLQLLLQAAEAGQRGYMLTGQLEYKEPYEVAKAQLESQLTRLRALFADDPDAQPNVLEIEDLTRRKASELKTTIELFEGGNVTGALDVVKTGIGLDHMRALDKLVATTATQEEIKMAYARRSLINTLVLNRLGIAALVLLSLLSLAWILRQSKRLDAAREEQRAELQLERDRLETEVERRTLDLTELARHLQTVREDERSRLARELHDELGGLLTAAKLDVARVKSRLKGAAPEIGERIGHLVQSLDAGIALKRRIIEDLRPSTLSNLGLNAALEVLCAEFSRRTDVKVQAELGDVSLPEDAQLTAYRVVQEALTNVAKYAKAHHVTVRLQGDGEVARLSVSDDGAGFDTRGVPMRARGLAGMRFRVASHGGRLDLTSQPGQGTTIEVQLPQSASVPADREPTSA